MLPSEVNAVAARYRLPQAFAEAYKNLALAKLTIPVGRNSTLSAQTQLLRLTTHLASFRELIDDGYTIETPFDCDSQHIAHLVRKWIVDFKQLPGTVENKLTHFRAFALWIGKPQIVRPMREYLERPEAYRRSYSAQADKTWSGNKISAIDVIGKIAPREPHIAIQLRLQLLFGLRPVEAFLLQPRHISESGMLFVNRTSEGKSVRELPIETPEQWQALLDAQELENPSDGCMIPAPYTFRRWRAHYYYVLHRHGLTTEEMGITSIGLRHEFVNSQYVAVTGVQAAVKGGAEVATKLHRQGLLRLGQVAGYKSPNKAASMLGTHTREPRPRPDVATAIAILEKVNGNMSRAAAALGVSRACLYRLVPCTKLVAIREAVPCKE
ncbi:helix-turn-helix domain-containing protein [Cupriavidus sp. SW-Y-13]|uniref:helix-turn-helix domain-containing protein n=1 Tax=Cupriavidus sp. SW-Y-13 TaxID=2653854 RepID=UPI001365CEB5|nr:helix-turn-helix domain-containing protein [Cupriavidus sp. SW-Y-13]